MKTVDIISAKDATLHLSKAILLYESRAGYGHHVYASTHSIDIDASNPHRRVIGAGTPMKHADLVDFAAAVNIKTAHTGFVPDSLLYTSPTLMAWWVPAAVRTTWFKTEYPQIGVAHGQVAHPALVFIATRSSWYVFALRTSARPTTETMLDHAPHFNVNDQGLICTGNVQLPGSLSTAAMADYETAFFRSHFTHSNRRSTRAVRRKGGLTGLWADQLAAPDTESMRRALMSTKQTLRTAIERIANNHQI